MCKGFVRVMAGMLCVLLAMGELCPVKGTAVGVSAASAVLMDGEGRILYEKDANTRRPMASTTKIMTALVVIENCSLSERVIIPKEAVGVEGSSVYLVANETLTVEQLLYALMLASANDAATALALYVSGSIEAFALRMNEKAAALGLTDTAFANPHGLDHENHYTTAKELALLTAYAMKNEAFRTIVSTVKTTIPMNGTPQGRWLTNHNRLLRSYKGCIGVKTGFTKRSGRCLVSAAVRDGVLLIAVTLQASDDWNDHKAMLDYGFSTLTRVSLLPEWGWEATVPLVGGEAEFLHCCADGPLAVTLSGKDHEIRTVIEMRRFYFAPIAEGQGIGELVFYDGDTEIARQDIYAVSSREARKEKQTFWEWLLSLLGMG